MGAGETPWSRRHAQPASHAWLTALCLSRTHGLLLMWRWLHACRWGEDKSAGMAEMAPQQHARRLDTFPQSDAAGEVVESQSPASFHYPLLPASVQPAFACMQQEGVSTFQTQRTGAAAPATMRAGRWMQPVAYTVPYPRPLHCFPERCAPVEPSAPCLPAASPRMHAGCKGY